MASQTTNYHLVKPAYTDTADIADINGDMDIIDGALADKLDKANVYNGLDKTAAGDALDARQGKVLNDQFVDHWGKTYGNSQNPIADLDDLPVNGGGVVTLAASLSPNGSVALFSFEKLGTANRYTVKLTRIRNNSTYESYIGEMYDGTFLGWIRTPNGIVDNLTSTSSTDALSAKQGKVLNEAKANGKQAEWITNGYDPIANETGYFCYSTNPNNLPAQGVPTERTTYGTIFGDCSGRYKSMFYLNVYGDLYAWKTNGTPEWYKLALKSEVDAKVSKSGDTMTGNLTVPKVVGLVNMSSSSGAPNDGVGSANAFRMRELGSSSSLPNTSWYHILEAQGNNSNYGTQLALGISSDEIYYRKKATTWGDYHRLDNAKHVDWGTSIAVNNCGHALVLIGHRIRVVVWLVGDAGIDIGVTSIGDDGVTGFYKETAGNSITFGATASSTAITITRSGNSFTMKSTDNTTNRSWTIYQY